MKRSLLLFAFISVSTIYELDLCSLSLPKLNKELEPVAIVGAMILNEPLILNCLYDVVIDKGHCRSFGRLDTLLHLLPAE